MLSESSTAITWECHHLSKEKSCLPDPFCWNMNCWASEGRERKASSNYNGDLVMNLRALWTSSWCDLCGKTLWIQPRSPGRRFLCPDVSEPLLVRCCPWKEWSNGRAKQTMPCALLTGAFSEGSNHIQLLKRKNSSDPSGCGINTLLCFVSVHS